MKKGFFSIILICLVMAFGIVANAEIILTDENVDSFVGTKIIDESIIVDINSRNMNVNPYKVFDRWNKNAGCVDYVCARHWEKLKIHYLVNGSTGNGRDCARNHINGKQMTSLMTGITYTVHTFFNDDGANIKANSWVSFESSTDSRGHVIFVEYVKTDSKGVKQIYYTDNVSRGVLKKVSLENFVSGKIPGNSATKYLGTAWYEASGTSSKQEEALANDGVYYIVSALNNEKSAVCIEGDSTKSKANVHLWTRHTGDSQKFKITKSGSYYTITNFKSGMALDVYDASTKSGANVWQYAPNGTKAQQWTFEDAGNGYVYIKSALGNYLDVDDADTDNGTNIQVYKGNKTNAQKWKLVPAYYLDINGIVDGKSKSKLTGFATVDVYINGQCVANDVTDYYLLLASDATYEIKDIKIADGYEFSGSNVNLAGNVGKDDKNVEIYITKKHSHSYETKYESSHPHKQYKICSCGDKYYTGNTRTVDGCDGCHEHSYSTKYESAHPHKQYKICDCGDSYYTGSTRMVNSCTTCNPPEEECRHSRKTNYTETEHPHKKYTICTECGVKEYTGDEKTELNCPLCCDIEVITYSYTLYYDGNGGIEPPSPVTKTSGSKVEVTSEKMSRTGYEFLGWAKTKRATVPDYTGGETIILTKDTILYAVWKETEASDTLILTIDSKKATYNGYEIYNDVAPIIENGRTMLPARFIAENLGASVTWHEGMKKVIIKNDSTTIEITIGSSTALVNGTKHQLDSPAFISSSRTYTPVRFICEALGATVEWDAKTRQVIITK